MMIGWIDIVVDWMANQRSRAFVLCPLVLEPRLHLSLSELEGEREDLTISREKVVLLLKPSFKDLDLLRSETHSTSLRTIVAIC